MKKGSNLGELVKTADGSLSIRNPDIDEEYHSTAGAAFESQELYMTRSGFLEFLESSDSAAVLDVGLGLGYNALSTIENWLKADSPGNIDLVSLEINEDLVTHLAGGDGPWMENWREDWLKWGKTLEQDKPGLWQGKLQHSSGSSLNWQVLVGDSSRAEIPNLGFRFVWQDAFSPKKNPELWSPEWFAKVASVAASDCRLVTYSVARVVKDGLEGGGWDYDRIPAPGKKKHWLSASKKA